MYLYRYRDQSVHSSFTNFNEESDNNHKNVHILKWWNSSHDQLLKNNIESEQWHWYNDICDKIVAMTPEETIKSWQVEDELCLETVWYNVLLRFAVARAGYLGYLKLIREPKWKVCPLCNLQFVEDSLPSTFIKRLGINQLDFCAPCLLSILLQGTGDNKMSKKEIIDYLKDLTEALQRIPTQNFGEGTNDILYLTHEERVAVLKILKRKPSLHQVKKKFKSWLNALIEAGILEDGTRKTARGTQCLAKDGHVCFSLGEKTIDDFLYSYGVNHEKETHYPESKLRVDFIVNGVFIEYFGLAGNVEYDFKTQKKQEICIKYEISLISIFPKDLISSTTLREKLSTLLI